MTTIVRGGVTYNIIDLAPGGLSEDDVAAMIDKAQSQPTVARMNADLAASSNPSDRVVTITIDNPLRAGNPGSDVDKDTLVMDIDSRQMAKGDYYKVAGTGNGAYPGDAAQISADQIFVHELAHIHDARINGRNLNDPNQAAQSER